MKKQSQSFKIILVLTVLAVILLVFALSPIATGKPTPEKAANAIAESSCLLFDNELSFDEIANMTKEIAKKYDFDSPQKIDEYLRTIANSEDENTTSVLLRESLQKNCGSALAEKSLDPADLSKAILTE